MCKQRVIEEGDKSCARPREGALQTALSKPHVKPLSGTLQNHISSLLFFKQDHCRLTIDTPPITTSYRLQSICD